MHRDSCQQGVNRRVAVMRDQRVSRCQGLRQRPAVVPDALQGLGVGVCRLRPIHDLIPAALERLCRLGLPFHVPKPVLRAGLLARACNQNLFALPPRLDGQAERLESRIRKSSSDVGLRPPSVRGDAVVLVPLPEPQVGVNEAGELHQVGAMLPSVPNPYRSGT